MALFNILLSQSHVVYVAYFITEDGFVSLAMGQRSKRHAAGHFGPAVSDVQGPSALAIIIRDHIPLWIRQC